LKHGRGRGHRPQGAPGAASTAPGWAGRTPRGVPDEVPAASPARREPA